MKYPDSSLRLIQTDIYCESLHLWVNQTYLDELPHLTLQHTIRSYISFILKFFPSWDFNSANLRSNQIHPRRPTIFHPTPPPNLPKSLYYRQLNCLTGFTFAGKNSTKMHISLIPEITAEQTTDFVSDMVVHIYIFTNDWHLTES